MLLKSNRSSDEVYDCGDIPKLPERSIVVLWKSYRTGVAFMKSNGKSRVLFDRMTCYHSEEHAGRLATNNKGHLVWQCRKPDQLVAHMESPLKISSTGDVAEFRILWKSSGTTDKLQEPLSALLASTRINPGNFCIL